MKKSIALVVSSALVLAFAALTTTVAEEVKSEESKSVAWYVANLKEARKQNQECHDNPGLQANPSCVNALHALEISFKGGN
jgi:hypothetical protein